MCVLQARNSYHTYLFHSNNRRLETFRLRDKLWLIIMLFWTFPWFWICFFGFSLVNSWLLVTSGDIFELLFRAGFVIQGHWVQSKYFICFPASYALSLFSHGLHSPFRKIILNDQPLFAETRIKSPFWGT